MKLAYIVENYGQTSETFVTDLVYGLARSGADVQVFEDRRLSSCHESACGLPLLGWCGPTPMVKIYPATRHRKIFLIYPMKQLGSLKS